MDNVKYKVLKIPSLDELLSFVRPIKVNNPDKEKFYDDLRISYSIKNFKYLDKKNDDKISYNDVVELSSISTNKKFNAESIWITVGRKTFDEEFEKNILGLQAGEEKSFNIRGDDINVKIKSITKKYYGEVSIEDIKSEFPDVESIEPFFEQQYEKRCAELLEEKITKLIVTKLCAKLTELSDIEFDKDELKAYINEKFKQLSSVVIPEGIPEEYKKFFDISPLEAKIRSLDFLNHSLSIFLTTKSREELKNMLDSEIDDMLLDAIQKELFFRTINIEFARIVNYIPSKEEYIKYISDSAKRAGLSAEDFISKTRNTYELYAESKINIASFYYFKEYAYKNLIKK